MRFVNFPLDYYHPDYSVVDKLIINMAWITNLNQFNHSSAALKEYMNANYLSLNYIYLPINYYISVC
ncbi:MAG: hypothetical protein ACXVDU_04655 [Bacteroidia bacterium]